MVLQPPFSVVDTKILMNFVPLYKIHTLFPQETDKNRIVKRWAEEKVKVRNQLVNDLAGSCCGITTDMWTSTAKRVFMVTTLHYINQSWKIKNVTIAFIRMLYPQTGKRLAKLSFAKWDQKYGSSTFKNSVLVQSSTNELELKFSRCLPVVPSKQKSLFKN